MCPQAWELTGNPMVSGSKLMFCKPGSTMSYLQALCPSFVCWVTCRTQPELHLWSLQQRRVHRPHSTAQEHCWVSPVGTCMIQAGLHAGWHRPPMHSCWSIALTFVVALACRLPTHPCLPVQDACAC
jgi:hypothetical protein